MLLVVSIIIAGCGGEGNGLSGSSSSSPTDVTPEGRTLYYAQDVVRDTVPASTFYVDLSDSMESSDGSNVILTEVTPLSVDEKCRVESVNPKGFTLEADSVKACDYRYKVSTGVSRYSTSVMGDGFAEATARVAVGESTESLPPLSDVTVSNTSVTIDLPSKLSQLGYDLDTDTYSLTTTVNLPNGEATLSAAVPDPTSNTIEYTPGTGLQMGVERILFSYDDGVNVLYGSLDVAVSTESNGAPSAESSFMQTYTHPETGYSVKKIPNGLTTRIDVSHLISDPDGDTLHLVDVFTYGATVNIPLDANNDGNNFNDTVFEINSTLSGINNVSYAVSDGKGGYAVGVLMVNVASVYGNILLDTSEPNLLFAPPLTARTADAAGIKYVPVKGDGVTAIEGMQTAAHPWIPSNGYCESRGGSLPTMVALQRLRQHLMASEGTASPELFQYHQWPEDLPYWSSTQGITSGHFQAYDFGVDATLEDENGELFYYVTCLSNESIEVRVSGRTTITTDVNPSQPDPSAPDLDYQYQLISISADGSEEALDNRLVTWTAYDLPHYADFSAQSATVTIHQSEILDTDEGTDFRLVGCTANGICEEKVIRVVLFSWNTIIETESYQFSPFLNLDSANAAGITNPLIDYDDWTVVDNLHHDWFQGPYITIRSVEELSTVCSEMNIDGGGWSAMSQEVYMHFGDALDDAFNDNPEMYNMTRQQVYGDTGLNTDRGVATSTNIAVATTDGPKTQGTHMSGYVNQLTPNWTHPSQLFKLDDYYYGSSRVVPHVICYRTK